MAAALQRALHTAAVGCALSSHGCGRARLACGMASVARRVSPMDGALDIDDHGLVARFRRRRDAASFRALYRHVTPAVYATAVRLAGSGARAEDLTQEAWVRAVERLDAFDGRSTFRTWLTGIVVNCHREAVRRQSRPDRDAAAHDDALVTSLAVTPRAPADALDLERALTQLAPGYREIVLLHDVSGYTHREIATMLEISEGTSKSQLKRGREQLRALLSRRADGGPRTYRGGET